MTIDSKSMSGKQDRLRTGLIAIVLAASSLAFSQNAKEFQPVSSGSSNAAIQVTGPVLGEIDDPSTGCRWILFGNAAHPEGPGRVVPADEPQRTAFAASGLPSQPAKESVRDQPLQPVIHAGDTVVVEEHTPVVDARLAAVALSRAAPGDEFRARLKIGGKVVRARAVDSLRATLLAGTEGQP